MALTVKHFSLEGITGLRGIDGTNDWFYGIDANQGDIYEVEEIVRLGKRYVGGKLVFVSYPDGEVFEPYARTENIAVGSPVFSEGRLYWIRADFTEKVVEIHSFDCEDKTIAREATIDLNEVCNTYNLMLHVSPVSLTRQGPDDSFEIIWPERVSVQIKPRESFFLRDGDKLYFNEWFEDPDYREVTNIRSALTGDIIGTFDGDCQLMPNGEIWSFSV